MAEKAAVANHGHRARQIGVGAAALLREGGRDHPQGACGRRWRSSESVEVPAAGCSRHSQRGGVDLAFTSRCAEMLTSVVSEAMFPGAT